MLVVALSLLATATPADTDDPWKSDSKQMTCSQTAWPLTVLGVVGLVVILALAIAQRWKTLAKVVYAKAAPAALVAVNSSDARVSWNGCTSDAAHWKSSTASLSPASFTTGF